MSVTPEQQNLINQILAGEAITNPAYADLPPFRPVLDLDGLIAAARDKMNLTPIAAAKNEKLEAPDAELVNTLLAQADEWDRREKEAKAERAKITDFFRDLVVSTEDATGKPISELTVHGATIFTYKPSISRILNQAHIKSLFPDLPENAEMWIESTSRRALYK